MRDEELVARTRIPGRETTRLKFADMFRSDMHLLGFLPTTPRKMINMSTPRGRYGFLNFVFDAVLTLLTSGLWLIWVFVREMRNR